MCLSASVELLEKVLHQREYHGGNEGKLDVLECLVRYRLFAVSAKRSVQLGIAGCLIFLWEGPALGDHWE